MRKSGGLDYQSIYKMKSTTPTEYNNANTYYYDGL